MSVSTSKRNYLAWGTKNENTHVDCDPVFPASENAAAAGGTEFMHERLTTKTIRDQIVISTVEREILWLGKHDQVAVASAYRAIAAGHFVIS